MSTEKAFAHIGERPPIRLVSDQTRDLTAIASLTLYVSAPTTVLVIESFVARSWPLRDG
jgi:hypothetical protein